MKKRILSIFLAALMVFSLLPVTALAVDKPTYNIRYDLNGGTKEDAGQYSETYTSGTQLIIAPAAYKYGYTFSGWRVEGSDQLQTTLTIPANAAGDKFYFAEYAPKPYKIRFDGNSHDTGETPEVTPDPVFDAEATLTMNGFVKSGYDFAGWTNTPGSDVPLYSDGQKVKNLVQDMEADVPGGPSVQLYAVWFPTGTPTCTYQSNDTSMGSVSRVKEVFAEGSCVGATATPNRGYRFVKWTDAGGNIVSQEAAYVPTAAGTYTAVFEAVNVQYSVEYYKELPDLDGSYALMETKTLSALAGSEVTANTESVPEGHHLSGVFGTRLSGTVTPDQENVGNVTSNLTLRVFYDKDHVHNEGESTVAFEKAITTEAELNDLFTSGGSGYLANDITATAALTVAEGKTVSLCLNDKVLNLNENGNTIIIGGSGTVFNLYDCGKTVRYWDKDGSTGLWTLAANQTTATAYTTTGGVITGGYVNEGGGVSVTNAGSFTMTGGTICGNKAVNGGGVYVSNTGSSFTMTGGTICGNAAITFDGGGVDISNGASMTMLGGTIRDNTCSRHGGGIADYSSLTLGGTAVVRDNNSADGTANDLRMSANKTFTFGTDGNKPADGMDIRVNTYNTPTAGNPVAISDSTAAEAYVKYIHADSSDYKVVYDQASTSLKLEARTNGYWYIDENGEEQTVPDADSKATAASSDTQWNAKWVLVSGKVTINNAVTLNDNVNLILAYGASLEITKGITSDSKTLTVYTQSLGSGKLTVTGANGSKGVPNGNPGGNGVTGNVTVNGGTVAITGGMGGEPNTSNAQGGTGGNGVTGNVTVTGGTLTITGGNGYLDKGQGSSGGFGVSGGTVTVSGEGSVTLIGGTGRSSGRKPAFSGENSAVDASVETSTDGSTYTPWNGTDALNGFQYLKLTALPPHIHGEGESAIEFTPIKDLAALKKLFADGGSGYLTAKIDCTEVLTVTTGKTVNLCLNGKVLNLNGKYISIPAANTVLSIYDCDTTTVHKFSVNNTTGLWTLNEASGTKTVTGGIITGGSGHLDETNYWRGGAVHVNCGTLNLYGGTLVGNQINSEKANQGGAVFVGGGDYSKGKFNMYGGAIVGNYSKSVGSGVFVDKGKMTMTGGSITDNVIGTNYSGAVYVVVVSGEITLGGTAKILNNFDSDGKQKNLMVNGESEYHPNGGWMIRFDDNCPPVDGFKVGACMYKGATGTFTEKSAKSGYEKFFVSDDGYKVSFDSSKNTLLFGERPEGSAWYIDENGDDVTLAAGEFTTVAGSSSAVTWDGTKPLYVSGGKVTISDAVTLSADTVLILADGAELEITLNKNLADDAIRGKKTLAVYGQSLGSGKLTVSDSTNVSIAGVEGNVTVNGGKVKISGSSTAGNGFGVSGDVTVNGGEVEISGTSTSSSGVGYGVSGNVTVNGGKVEISGSSKNSVGYGVCGMDKVITVSGGEAALHGTSAAVGSNLQAVNASVETSSDGVSYTDWDKTTALTTFKYLKLTKIPHEHSFTYEASENTITATCSVTENCSLDDNKATLTLTAEDAAYTGSAYEATTDDEAVGFTEATGATVAIEYWSTGASSEKLNSAPITPGSYTAKAVVTYPVADGTATVTAVKDFKITKKDLAKEDLSITKSDAVYDKLAHGATVALKDGLSGIGEITVKYQKKNADSTWGEATTEAPVDAGTYKIVVSALSGDNFNATAADLDTEATFTISPKTVELVWQPATGEGAIDLVYSGKEKVPTVTVKPEILLDGDECAVTAELTAENDNVNVGSFTFTAKSLSNSNYELPSTKVSDSYTITPFKTSLGNLVNTANFDNNRHGITFTPVTPEGANDLQQSDFTVKYYKVDMDTDAITPLTKEPANLGRYIYVVTLNSGHDNYTLGSENLFSGTPTSEADVANKVNAGVFTIGVPSLPTQQKPISFEKGLVNALVTDTGVTNALTNENTSTLSATTTYSSSNTSVATVDATTGEVTIVAAGSTTITATSHVANPDVTDVYASYTLNVTKNAITVTVKDKGIIYGGANPYEGYSSISDVLEFSETIDTTSITPAFTTSYAPGKSVGQYNVSVTLPESAEYSFTYVPGTLTVDQKELKVSDFTVSAEDKDYDGSNIASVKVTAIGNLYSGDAITATAIGTFADANVGTGKTVNYEITGISGAKAGNYKLTGQMTGNNITADIDAMPVTFTVGSTEFYYDGTAKTVAITAKDAKNNSFTAFTVTYGGAASQTAVGNYDIAVTLTDNNYTIANTAAVTGKQLKISKMPISFTFGASEFGYDGGKKTVQVSAADKGNRVFTDYTVKYKSATYAESTTAPTDVGIYTVTAVYDTNKYECASNTTTLTITAGDAVVWASAGLSHKFDGQPKAVTAMSAQNGLTLNVTYYAVNNSTNKVGEIVAAPFNIGRYLYVITLDNNKNYVISNPLDTTNIVGKAISELTGSNFGYMTIENSVQPGLVVDQFMIEKTYGDEPFTPTVSGGANGAALTYSIVSGGEFIDVDENGEVTIVKPGTAVVKVTASAIGYDDTTAQYAVRVEKKPLAITLKDSVVYTGKAITSHYEVTGEVDGTPFDASSIAFNYQNLDSAAENPHVFRNVGTYYVTAEIPSDNAYYCSVSTAAKNISITKADLTVTADNKTVTYGDAAPTYTVSYTPLGDDVVGCLGGTAAYTCEYDQFDDVGTYTISVTGLTSPNYDITFADGTLTVNPKPVTLNWSNNSFTYDGKEHSVTATVANAVNSDTVTVTAYTNNAKTAADSYSAEATALSNANYTLTGGTDTTKAWTIAQKSVTVKPANVSVYVNGTAELKLDVSALLAADREYTGTPSFTLTDKDGQSIAPTDAVKTAGTYTITWTNPDGVSFNENYTVTKTTTATLTVSQYSSGGSTGGGGTGGTAVPVSGDSDSIEVKATISNGNAELENVTSEELEKVGTGKEVIIDLSGVKKDVTGITIPKTTIENIAASDADGLKVKFPNGTVAVFDKTAVAAISKQAAGEDIRLVVDRDSKAEQSMTAAQKETLKALNNPVVLDAYFVSGGKRISDFKGGEAELTAVYPTEKPVRVWYVKDDGTKELVPSTFDGKAATFVVTHFSHYVIEELDGSYSICPQDETCVYAKFTDADTKAWYHDGVHFCVENGYMQGVSTTAFDPSGTTTRAMIVTMLWRMEGELVANYAMSFKDVADGQWYTEAIRWAQSTGIVEGYSAEAFGPNDPITREQMATILYRHAKYHEIDVANTNTLAGFTDVNKVSSWALDAMKWANAAGLVQGRTTTTLVPEVSITRAEAATMIQRYCENVLGE